MDLNAWEALIEAFGIITNTAVLIYIVWRFDQAIRGAEKGLRANIANIDEFRTEMRLQSDRTERRIERLENNINKKGA
jgi:hypothetical protein